MCVFFYRTASVALNLPIKAPAPEETTKPKSVTEATTSTTEIPLPSSSILHSLRAEKEQRTEVPSTSVEPKYEVSDVEMASSSSMEVIESKADVPHQEDMSVDDDYEDEGEAHVVC